MGLWGLMHVCHNVRSVAGLREPTPAGGYMDGLVISVNGPSLPCGVAGERPALSGVVSSSAPAPRLLRSTVHCLLGVHGWTHTTPTLYSAPSPQPHLCPHAHPDILVAFSQQACPFLNFHWACFYVAPSTSSLLRLWLGGGRGQSRTKAVGDVIVQGRRLSSAVG